MVLNAPDKNKDNNILILIVIVIVIEYKIDKIIK